MQIVKVQEIKGFSVETDENEFMNYIRYSKDCWYVSMGESDEPVYDCEEIEKLFQEHQNKYNNQANYQARNARMILKSADDTRIA